jgi:hypothetical protein
MGLVSGDELPTQLESAGLSEVVAMDLGWECRSDVVFEYSRCPLR